MRESRCDRKDRHCQLRRKAIVFFESEVGMGRPGLASSGITSLNLGTKLDLIGANGFGVGGGGSPLVGVLGESVLLGLSSSASCNR